MSKHIHQVSVANKIKMNRTFAQFRIGATGTLSFADFFSDTVCFIGARFDIRINTVSIFGVDPADWILMDDGEVAVSQDLTSLAIDVVKGDNVVLYCNLAGSFAHVGEKLTAQIVVDDGMGGTGVVESIVAGTNITVDDTDPANPIVSATPGGGGSTWDVLDVYLNANTPATSSIVVLNQADPDEFSFNAAANKYYQFEIDYTAHVDVTQGLRHELNFPDHLLNGCVIHTIVAGESGNITPEDYFERNPNAQDGGSPHPISNSSYARIEVKISGSLRTASSLSSSGICTFGVGQNNVGSGSEIWSAHMKVKELF